MPLPLRRVESVHVSRGTLPERFKIQNDLEAVSNGSLANIIVQLSSLSHHAEELFGDLIRVGSEIATRANNLQARIDRLAVKVIQMDNNQEESCSMQEALNTKPFQSSMSFDQQVVSRVSMPMAMLKTYQLTDPPPPLDKLNSYRDDGKDGLKFYTDPSYFFDLWRQEMLKDTDKVMKKPHKPKQDGGQKHKKRVRQPQNTRERHKHIVIEQGEHIMQNQEYNRPGSEVKEILDGGNYQIDYSSAAGQPRAAQGNSVLARPNSIELEKGYPPGYTESPYNNETEANSRGDFRSYHLQQQQAAAVLNRNLSQSQYDYEAYNNQIHNYNHSQHRYYSTPPPAYSDVSSPSPNAYSRFSASGIAASSTPRNGTLSISVASNSSMSNGYAFRPLQPPPAPPPNYVGTPPGTQMNSGTPTRSTRMMNSRDTLPPPPPPPVDNETNHMNGMMQHNGISVVPLPPPLHHNDEHDDPLPPPPPPPDNSHNMNASIENLAPSPELVPPPPPPLPLGETAAMSPEKFNLVTNGGISKKIEKRSIPAPVWDGRGELLKAIRDGIELRKVETKKEPAKEDKAGGSYCDVASILARRVAVEMSDSDSGSDSDQYDSDQWDEASA